MRTKRRLIKYGQVFGALDKAVFSQIATGDLGDEALHRVSEIVSN